MYVIFTHNLKSLISLGMMKGARGAVILYGGACVSKGSGSPTK